MIHYISTAGPRDAWVVNELEIVERAGIPFQLHALRSSDSTYFVSAWGQRLASLTSVIYPLRAADVAHILVAPFRFHRLDLRASEPRMD